MKLQRRSSLVIGLLILLSLVACGRPKPAPITNPSHVETALAGTARALAKQTETANGYTPTPLVLPTETLTPTPKISLHGMSLIIRDDQSTLFIDHTAGIQLILPAGWMAMRVNEDEYYKAFTSDVVLANPVFSDRLTTIQDADLDRFRLDAFDIREGHVINGVISDLSVVFEKGDKRTLEKWAQAEASVKRPFKNFRHLPTRYMKTADGTKVLVIEQSWSANPSETVFYRGVFFNLSTGTLILDFFTNKSFKDTVLPEFEDVVNSVTFLNP